MNSDALKKIKERLNQQGKDLGGANSEWAELVGDLTEFLRKEKRPQDKEISYARVAQYVSYIHKAGGLGELRQFIKDVKQKGAWFFWWTVKPKSK